MKALLTICITFLALHYSSAQIDTTLTVNIPPTSTEVILTNGLTDSTRINVSNTGTVPLRFCMGKRDTSRANLR